MSILDRVHGSLVFPRRVRVLGERIAGLLPEDARVIDVGAGDGSLAASLLECRPDLDVTGIDVLVRPDTHVPVLPFDGKEIPYEDGSFDAAILVDVVHHAVEPVQLLREVARVASTCVVVKDHTLEGRFADATLRFMDRVGNLQHGVALPRTYWTRDRWLAVFNELHLRVSSWDSALALYVQPASLLFDRSLHFVARLEQR